MAYKLGGNGRIYYGGTSRTSWPTSGAASGLTILNRVGDVKLPLEKGEDDATTRDTPGWEASFATLIKGAVDFKLLYDSADAGYQALETNFFATSGATLALAILDGDKATVGTKGLWADFQVFKFEKGENVKGIQTVDVTIKPGLAPGTNTLGPAWVTVA